MTEDGGITANDISLQSHKSMVVRVRKENGSNQLYHVVFDRDGMNSIDIDADHFGLSGDGKYLLVSTGNKLSLVDYPNHVVIDEMSYDDDCNIQGIRWVTTTLAAIMLSHKMYVFDVENRSEMTLITPIDESIPVEKIVGISIDFTIGCYLIQADDGQLGITQLGMFGSKPVVLSGQAACLCSLNCLSIKGLVALTVSVYDKEPNTLLFRVTPMDQQLRYHFKTSLIRIPGLSPENRPDYIIPDPKHGLATIVFHNGYIHIWDILNQELTLSSFIYPRPAIASCFAPPAGFIMCFEEEPIVYRIDLDNLGFVSSVYNDGKVELAMHLAVRLGLRDTKDPQFQTLIGSLVRKDKKELQEAIGAFVDVDHFDYPQFIASRFIADVHHLSDLSEFIFGIWSSERRIEWKDRIRNYLRNFDGPAEDDVSRDIASSRSSAVISDTSDFDMIPVERTVSHGLRESVRLTSTRVAQDMAQKVRQMAGIETVSEEAVEGGEEVTEEGGKFSQRDEEAVAAIAAVLRLAQVSLRRNLLSECVKALFPEALRHDAEAAVAQFVELDEKPREEGVGEEGNVEMREVVEENMEGKEEEKGNVEERETVEESKGKGEEEKGNVEKREIVEEELDPRIRDNELTRRLLNGEEFTSEEFNALFEKVFPNKKGRVDLRKLYKKYWGDQMKKKV